MPELPDVETFKRYLDATALHQRIDGVRLPAPELLKETSPRTLRTHLRHARLEATRRHGKYLFVRLDRRDWLVLHFGMTGGLKYFRDKADQPDYTRLLLRFRTGYRLAYLAPRKLGRISLTHDPGAFARDHALGRDALDSSLTFAAFRAMARGRRGTVKAWLMDQSALAGIGNVYSDEILFQAGIHPRRKVSALHDDELRRLFRSRRRVLEAAVKARVDPQRMPSAFLLPHRESGAPCPRCGTAIRQQRLSGRTSYYCPHCQPVD